MTIYLKKSDLENSWVSANTRWYFNTRGLPVWWIPVRIQGDTGIKFIQFVVKVEKCWNLTQNC